MIYAGYYEPAYMPLTNVSIIIFGRENDEISNE